MSHAIVTVGLPDAAVKEARDRVSTALTDSGFKFPMGRTTINLAPADAGRQEIPQDSIQHRSVSNPVPRKGASLLRSQCSASEFKYTSSSVYPSAFTELATFGSFKGSPCAFFHSSGMPSFALDTGDIPDL